MLPTSQAHRGTIFVEDAEVLSQHRYPKEQYVLRVRAPKCAGAARAGSFAHITCDPVIPMRRPLSIMRVSREQGWVEFLYKVVGEGLTRLACRQKGDTISLMGPIGEPFRLHTERPRPLLIGGGVGIPPMVFASDEARRDSTFRPLVLMGSEIPFPFDTKPSTIIVDGIPAQVTACMPLLEAWEVPSRLASLAAYPGCFEGYVTDLARVWIESLDRDVRQQIEILACGPAPMLCAAIELAKTFELPCQVSLEEYMACATGGCAGCTVLISTPDGQAMKRVCVDGPVFDGYQVHPEALKI